MMRIKRMFVLFMAMSTLSVFCTGCAAIGPILQAVLPAVMPAVSGLLSKIPVVGPLLGNVAGGLVNGLAGGQGFGDALKGAAVEGLKSEGPGLVSGALEKAGVNPEIAGAVGNVAGNVAGNAAAGAIEGKSASEIGQGALTDAKNGLVSEATNKIQSNETVKKALDTYNQVKSLTNTEKPAEEAPEF